MSLSMYNTLTKIVVIVMALVSTNLYPKISLSNASVIETVITTTSSHYDVLNLHIRTKKII